MDKLSDTVRRYNALQARMKFKREVEDDEMVEVLRDFDTILKEMGV